MSENHGGGQEVLFEHVLMPVAREDDARKTAKALARYDPDGVTVLHVMKHGTGRPDKVSIQKKEEIGDRVFDAVGEVFPDANRRRAYPKEITDAIFEVAAEVDADSIVYRTTEDSRLMEALSEGPHFTLVTRAERPVLTLPRESYS